MRVDAGRFDAAACAAAVLLAAIAQGGCAGYTGGAGEAPRRTAAALVSPTPAPTPPAAATPEAAAAESPLPPPRGFVSDFAEVIDPAAEAPLEARLKRLRERAKIEIAVVTVETTGAQSASDYSLAVARGWRVGPPAGEEGGGVLLLLAVKDRKWQIQVTRGLEADLPGDVAEAVGSRMTTALRAGRYGEAVDVCVDGLVERLVARRGFPAREGEPPSTATPAAAATPVR